MNMYLINYAKWLIWQYYQTEWNNKLAIWIGWAPSLPSALDQEAQILSKEWFDVIRVECYGYARSSGFFSPQNCIQSIYDTIQVFRNQIPVISVYSTDELLLPYYDEIILIGWSYGWRIAAAMPRFDETIKEIVLLYPALGRLDRNDHWNPESTDEDFLREYLLGYKPIYRFEAWVDPYDAMLKFEQLFSLSEISHLSETKVFVWHGSADTVVRCGRSRQFVDDLRHKYPDGNYYYAEYYGLWHWWLCKNVILQGWLHWRKLNKVHK